MIYEIEVIIALQPYNSLKFGGGLDMDVLNTPLYKLVIIIVTNPKGQPHSKWPPHDV